MSRVKDMAVGDLLFCSRHGGEVQLTARMKREQTRICDACAQTYKAQHSAAKGAAVRVAKPKQEQPDMPGESWRDIPGFSGYQASTHGRVRSLDRTDTLGRLAFGRVLQPRKSERGYLSVGVTADGAARPQTRSVHGLVARAFHGPRPDGKEVAHGDGDPANCRPDNLRYATHVENEADKVAHGTKFIASGEANGHAKLSEADVREVLRRLAAGERQKDCARDLGVDPSLISHIKRGAHWAHVTGASNV